MTDASTDNSMMKMDVDDVYELFERIAENQANWQTNRNFPKKSIGVHNIGVATASTAQMEVVTKK